MNCAFLADAGKKGREDVIAKENDKAKILRLEKELMALKKQKAT